MLSLNKQIIVDLGTHHMFDQFRLGLPKHPSCPKSCTLLLFLLLLLLIRCCSNRVLSRINFTRVRQTYKISTQFLWILTSLLYAGRINCQFGWTWLSMEPIRTRHQPNTYACVHDIHMHPVSVNVSVRTIFCLRFTLLLYHVFPVIWKRIWDSDFPNWIYFTIYML